MGKSTHFPKLFGCRLKAKIGEGMSLRRSLRNTVVFQKGIANNMRGLSYGVTDT